jgi:hypothetical protein
MKETDSTFIMDQMHEDQETQMGILVTFHDGGDEPTVHLKYATKLPGYEYAVGHDGVSFPARMLREVIDALRLLRE